MIVLAAVVMALIMALTRPVSVASAQSTTAGRKPGGLFAVAGQLTPNTYGLYLVDTERGSIVVYEYVPHDGQSRYLQLRAARTTLFDTQLEAYNTSPDPAEVADLVRQARRISDGTTRPK